MNKPRSAATASHPAHATGKVSPGAKGRRNTAALSVAALGVVYGDIGTSPLYALNLLFFGQSGMVLNTGNILGGISLVIWALSIVVALKYAILVLRADNDGEGGVFALYGLLDKFNRGRLAVLSWSLLIGAGLLFGDGIITPAISVLSAIEGIAVATPVSNHAVMLLTIAVLSLLFAFQYKGTGGIGSIFGPVLIVWFVVIAMLGITQITQHPDILRALNPVYAWRFLLHSDWHGALLVLGALMLVLTGGEAMYADMGHFGARPIRISWFLIVYPALLLNYLGQGAYLLGGGVRLADNLFFSTVPSLWIYPMVALATVATVIASQALISGAFSLTAQSIALELLPRLKVVHTHHAHAGQVYVPLVNAALYLGCTVLVLSFGSSAALGSAYGLAVSGVMLTTSVAMFFVARRYWNWSPFRSALVFVPLATIDAAFLTANSLKFLDGGFIPLAIGVLIFLIMLTWRWGRGITNIAYAASHTMKMRELIAHHREAPALIERNAILMIPGVVELHGERLPLLLQMLWNGAGMLPRNLIFVRVVHPKTPYIHGQRYTSTVLERNDRGAIVLVELQFGFMEEPDVEQVLLEVLAQNENELPADRHQWIIHVALENLLPAKSMPRLRRFQLKVFSLLRNIARPAYYHYGLGDKVQLSAEIFPIHVK